MKRIATLLLAFFCLQAAAQETNPDRYHYFSDGRAVVKRDSLYGFIDRAGREVIPCQFKKAYPFNDGIAMVRKGYEVFAIDTMGNRLERRVKIPQFYNRDFENFVRWVRLRIPFASSDECERLKPEQVNALITIGRDGKIAGCENVSSTSDEAYDKVRGVVLQSPEWSAGQVDGRTVEISYLLPVDFGKLHPLPCRPLDEQGRTLGSDFVYPLFEGKYAVHFYDWFHRTLRFRTSQRYQQAAAGTVRAAFTIDRKGRLRDIEILSSHNDICREVTIETLRKSPRWTPGTVDGRPVAVRYELPFTFRFRR